MATEFVDGRTLRSVMQERGALPLAEAIGIIVQGAEALACAHAAGIVHRDIKPENLMIRRDGYVKLLDFGLATIIEPSTSTTATTTIKTALTSAGIVLGTVDYLSPEQARAQSVDSRTDIFSLGVVLYEMLTGTRPFRGSTTTDTIAAILLSDPPALERLPRRPSRSPGGSPCQGLGEGSRGSISDRPRVLRGSETSLRRYRTRFAPARETRHERCGSSTPHSRRDNGRCRYDARRRRFWCAVVEPLNPETANHARGYDVRAACGQDTGRAAVSITRLSECQRAPWPGHGGRAHCKAHQLATADGAADNRGPEIPDAGSGRRVGRARAAGGRRADGQPPARQRTNARDRAADPHGRTRGGGHSLERRIHRQHG